MLPAKMFHLLFSLFQAFNSLRDLFPPRMHCRDVLLHPYTLEAENLESLGQGGWKEVLSTSTLTPTLCR